MLPHPFFPYAHNMDNFISIENKVVMLTGAFGLIGKSLSGALLAQGAKLVLLDKDDSQKKLVEEELAMRHGNADFRTCIADICDPDAIVSCFAEAVGAFGKVDVLINNAAIDAKFDKSHHTEADLLRFEDFPLSLLERSMDVNIKGLFLMTQAACRQMLVQGYGHVINVASVYSLVAPNNRLYDHGDGKKRYKPVDYVLTKSVIPGFTRYIATAYAGENIRCNAIAPHGIFQDHDPAFVQRFSELSPLGRMAEAEELTGPFTFLISDASSYMNGTVLTVDGGWTAW